MEPTSVSLGRIGMKWEDWGKNMKAKKSMWLKENSLGSEQKIKNVSE